MEVSEIESFGKLIYEELRCIESTPTKSEDLLFEACVALEKLQDKNERLKKALRKYGWHKESCAYIQQLNAQVIAECDCGYEQALKGK